MTDVFDSIINDQRAAALSQTSANIDASPDDAQRAIELSQATGIHPSIISAGLEEFERNHKAGLASHIISQNPYLSDYVASDPMAAKVSNDDYGQLDTISNSLQKLRKAVAGDDTSIIKAAVEGFKSGFGEQPLGSWLSNDEIKNHRFAAALTSPVELSLRTLSGAIKGVTDAAVAGVEQATGSPRFARDVGGMIELATTAPHQMGGGIHVPELPPEMVQKNLEILQKAKPWIDAGQEPPHGLAPEIDKLKKEQNDLDLKGLDEALKEAQKSNTKERAPELFGQFIRNHVGNSKIEISGEALAKLYGDNPPTVDDNILGWVPGLKEQLDVAVATGGDVSVPMADWLAKVDPEVAKELHDSIRVRPGNVTKEEAKVFAEAKADIDTFHGSPHEFEAFDAQHIGSGEGAQSYGYGHYVAEARGVAEDYQKRLLPKSALDEIDRLRWEIESLPKGAERDAAIAEIERVQATSGNLYRVRIKRDPEEFLDYDKPASQQTPEIKEKLAKAWGIPADQFHDDLWARPKTAEDSKALSEAGIAGIKYLDQQSRGVRTKADIKQELELLQRQHDEVVADPDKAERLNNMDVVKIMSRLRDVSSTLQRELRTAPEQRTRNYVVFNDADLQIIERNGEAIRAVRESAGFKELYTDDEGLTREDLGAGVEMAYKPTEQYSQYEQQIVEHVQSVLSRIAPTIESHTVQKVFMKGREAGGAYLSYSDAQPLILVSLNSRDAGKTARHESIHFLRDYGFFSKDEWQALEQEARLGKWEDKHKIGERYKKYKAGSQSALEEAIAEEFGEWGSKTETARLAYSAEARNAFSKMAAFFKELLDGIKEIFGHTPTIDELFERIEAGEIGRREPGQGQGAVKAQEELPQSGTTRMEDREPFAGKFLGWLTQAQREKYLRLINERNAEDVAALEKKISAQLERERSKEWRDNKANVRAEVEQDIQNRPDIAADRLLGEGKLYGEKVAKPKIGREYLTEDQISALPPEYLSDVGMHPDDIAGLFGYPSGVDLVNKLSELTAARKAANMTPTAYARRVAELETERVMQERYGETPAEVLEAARDHVLSQTQMDLLHEQTYALASKAGLEFSLTKDGLLKAVKDAFGRTSVDAIDSARFMRDAGKAGRLMEGAFLKQDWAEAFRQSQRQYLAGLMAKEATKFEKEQKQFDRIAKRFSRREVKGVDQSATNQIRSLLLEAGRINEAARADLANLRNNDGFPTLPDYTDFQTSLGWAMDIADWIREGRVPQVEQMTVEQFRAFHDALKNIQHVGRETRTINVGGEKFDRDQLIQEIVDNVTELPARAKEKQNKLLFKLDAELTKVEEVFRDLDLRRQAGPFTRTIIRNMMDSKHTEYQLQEELTKKLAKMQSGSKKWMGTLDQSIPQDFFIDPDVGIAFDLSRKDLVGIMLNWGNRSNIEKFTKGWFGAEHAAEGEARLRQLIDRHATKEDWDFVQSIWDIFEGWKDRINVLYTNTSGLAPKFIKAEPIQTPHGEYAGGYFPVIYDEHYSNLNLLKERSDPNALFGKNYMSTAATANSHTISRTGYVDKIEFQNVIDALPLRMQQVMHDISYRSAVMEAGKLIYDRKVRAAIRKHYGTEYENQLDPWLKDVANHFNQNEKALTFFNSIMRRARMNLSAHALGLNLKVIGSPDVGSLNPAAIYRTLSNYDESVKLAYDKSQEIPHTYRNMDRDFRERLETLITKNGWDSFQAAAVRFAFLPLVKVSHGFRIVTFVDQYKKNLAKGLDDTTAAREADYEVRRRHGATGIPDLPAVMRGSEGMKVATMFYGYFNAMYNWQRHLPNAIRRGDYMEALNVAYGSVVIGSIFNALVFNKPGKQDRIDDAPSWGRMATRAVANQVTGTLPFVRDLSNALFEDQRTTTPMGTIIQAMSSAWGDIKRHHEGKQVQKPITHAANVVGLGLGLPLGQVGRTGQFAADVATGKQRPKNFFEWYRGVIHGEFKVH